MKTLEDELATSRVVVVDVQGELLREYEGRGKGNWGHKGRPGTVGGSGPGMSGIIGRAPVDTNMVDEKKAIILLSKGCNKLPNVQRALSQFREDPLLTDDADRLEKIIADLSDGTLVPSRVYETEPRLSHPIRMDIKIKQISDISKDTGIGTEKVGDAIQQWATTSNDTDMRSLHMQKMAAEEFGLELSKFTKNHIKDVESEREKKKNSMDDDRYKRMQSRKGYF